MNIMKLNIKNYRKFAWICFILDFRRKNYRKFGLPYSFLVVRKLYAVESELLEFLC